MCRTQSERTLLFVCTGNTCRSPMAAILCRRCHPEWTVLSAGIAARADDPASPHAITSAAEYDCDLTDHRARHISPSDVCKADVIYTMSDSHTALVQSRFPEAAHKIKTLPGGDVPDPYGGDCALYRAIAADLLERMKGL